VREKYCIRCKKEAEPAHRKACVGCRQRVWLCDICVVIFVGCDDECIARHREAMKTAIGSTEMVMIRDNSKLVLTSPKKKYKKKKKGESSAFDLDQ